MALTSPFFGKREPEPATPTMPAYNVSNGRNVSNNGRGDASSASNAANGAASTSHTGLRGDTAGTSGSSTNSTSSASTASTASTASGNTAASSGAPLTESSRLTVGPNIKLKGVEITDCDTLIVEGTVEATMDSRVIQIMANGAFKGSADIDIAEIHGKFDGNLTVRDKLVIFSQGKVNGTIRYGKVVIEEGGQLSGDVQFGTKAAVNTNSATHKAGIQAAT